MASYRYERDIDPKDLQPRKQRQYTRKERWANWWDYNLKAYISAFFTIFAISL